MTLGKIDNANLFANAARSAIRKLRNALTSGAANSSAGRLWRGDVLANETDDVTVTLLSDDDADDDAATKLEKLLANDGITRTSEVAQTARKQLPVFLRLLTTGLDLAEDLVPRVLRAGVVASQRVLALTQVSYALTEAALITATAVAIPQMQWLPHSTFVWFVAKWTVRYLFREQLSMLSQIALRRPITPKQVSRLSFWACLWAPDLLFSITNYVFGGTPTSEGLQLSYQIAENVGAHTSLFLNAFEKRRLEPSWFVPYTSPAYEVPVDIARFSVAYVANRLLALPVEAKAFSGETVRRAVKASRVGVADRRRPSTVARQDAVSSTASAPVVRKSLVSLANVIGAADVITEAAKIADADLDAATKELMALLEAPATQPQQRPPTPPTSSTMTPDEEMAAERAKLIALLADA